MALKTIIKKENFPFFLMKAGNIDIDGDSFTLYLKIVQQLGDATINKLKLKYYFIEGEELIETLFPEKIYEFVPNLESGINFIEQGYEHLKTLPEFEGCEDC